MYLFLALLALEVLRPMRQFLIAETLPTGQLRLAFSVFAMYCGIIFSCLRILLVSLGVFDGSRPLASAADFTSNVMLALCAAGFGLALAPLRFLAPAARVWIYFQQQHTLHQLEGVRRELVHITAPLPWPTANRRERLLQPSYELYCALIDISDRRSLLLAAGETQSATLPSSPKLNWLLAPLPQTEDWVELLQYFREKLNG